MRAAWAVVVLGLLAALPTSRGIDCFKCVSIGGDNPACEDPFHNNYTTDVLEPSCMGGRKNRNGIFPATSCVKLSGYFADNGHEMVVRGCALDSGSLTVDMELVRMSHCGGFYFDGRYVHGCVQICTEDACNAVGATERWLLGTWVGLFVVLMAAG